MRDMKAKKNYVFIELNGQDAYIKPANYEISKAKNTGPTLENSKIWHTIHPGIHISAGMGKN